MLRELSVAMAGPTLTASSAIRTFRVCWRGENESGDRRGSERSEREEGEERGGGKVEKEGRGEEEEEGGRKDEY